jgi:magnesium-transporting ATPase (P-type)
MTKPAASGGLVKDFNVVMSSFVMLSSALAAPASNGKTFSSSLRQSSFSALAESRWMLQSFSSISHYSFLASASFYFFYKWMSMRWFYSVFMTSKGWRSSNSFYMI